MIIFFIVARYADGKNREGSVFNNCNLSLEIQVLAWDRIKNVFFSSVLCWIYDIGSIICVHINSEM